MSPRGQTQQFRVLHVEDSPKVHEALKSRLDKRIEVVHAGSFHDAVRALAEQKFDALVFDVNFPKEFHPEGLTLEEHDEFLGFMKRNNVREEPDVLAEVLAEEEAEGLPGFIAKKHGELFGKRRDIGKLQALANDLMRRYHRNSMGTHGFNLLWTVRRVDKEGKPYPQEYDRFLKPADILPNQLNGTAPVFFYSDASSYFRTMVAARQPGAYPNVSFYHKMATGSLDRLADAINGMFKAR